MIETTEWKLSQFDRPHDYIRWTKEALKSICLPSWEKVVIFNCSDGPSALGFIQHMHEIVPHAEIILTDARQDIVTQCKSFILENVRYPVNIKAEQIITEELYSSTHVDNVNVFLSFEPIGDLVAAFSCLYPNLSESGQIICVSRGVLGHGIQGLRLAAKLIGVTDRFTVYSSGQKTEAGDLVVGMLAKSL